MEEESKPKKHGGGVPSRNILYLQIAKKIPDAIRAIGEELVKPSKMGGVRIAAAKILLNKALPDLKAIEVEDKSTTRILVKLDWLKEEKKDDIVNE